jgi:hypothetical protein
MVEGPAMNQECIYCNIAVEDAHYSARWVRTGPEQFEGYYEPFHSLPCSPMRTEVLMTQVRRVQ